MKPTILVENGMFVAVKLGRKDVTSDYDVLDIGPNAQCEQCLQWFPGTEIVIGPQEEALCSTCANLKV